MPPDKLKICRCCLTCGKPYYKKTRQQHIKKLRPDQRAYRRRSLSLETYERLKKKEREAEWEDEPALPPNQQEQSTRSRRSREVGNNALAARTSAYQSEDEMEVDEGDRTSEIYEDDGGITNEGLDSDEDMYMEEDGSQAEPGNRSQELEGVGDGQISDAAEEDLKEEIGTGYEDGMNRFQGNYSNEMEKGDIMGDVVENEEDGDEMESSAAKFAEDEEEETEDEEEEEEEAVDSEDWPQDAKSEQGDWAAYDDEEGMEAGSSQQVSVEELDEMLESIEGDDAVDEVSRLFKSRLAELTDEEKDNIQAFKLHLVSNMPIRAFQQMRWAFQHRMKIASLYVIVHKLSIIAGIQPKWYHCCPETCIAYIGKYAEEESCPICHQTRYNSKGKPRRYYCYIPLIPRLQHFFLNPSIINELLYRHGYEPAEDMISDVFDSDHYKNLCATLVNIDGVDQDYTYFSGENDIAFSLCLDSYLLYKRRRGGPSAMPLLVQIYNWRPEIRTHLRRLLCLGVIPGPKGPKELDTFLVPFEDECAALARGVKTHHVTRKENFDLRAYHIFPQGDIIAIEKMMKLKGHNGIVPCRECKIQGVCNKHGKEKKDKVYYVPLAKPGGQVTDDPIALRMRNHEDWANTTKKINDAKNKTQKNKIAKKVGIKGLPAIGRRVRSIDYAHGVPWDYMHLLMENVVKNLVHLWQGKFKGLDAVNPGRYVIKAKDWEAIGEETTAAVKNIPSTFVRSLGNIVEDQGHYTAEGWGFWFMFLGPILLKDRLKEPYYTHYLQLVDIMKICIQYSLPRTEINALKETIADWVEEYERLYYQYLPERLSVCTLTLHGLLHICDNILFCGPVWTTWTFWMERFCGYLQAGLRSRTYPWANLNNRLLQRSYISAIDLYYNLQDLHTQPKDNQAVKKNLTYQGYEKSILKNPRIENFVPNATLRHKIAGYFVSVLGTEDQINRTTFEKALPPIMPSHGRVQVKGGGDTIRAHSTVGENERARDATYVRYEILVEDGDSNLVREIFYGQLQYILECQLDNNGCWKNWKEERVLLAVLAPCKTEGRDAAKVVTEYSEFTTEVVVDLNAVVCVVGRALRGVKRWGIIDRSNDMVRPVFITEVEGTLKDDGGDNTDDEENEG